MNNQERKFEVIKGRKFGDIKTKKGEIYTETELFGDLISDKQAWTYGYVSFNTHRPIINYKMGTVVFLKHFKEVENA